MVWGASRASVCDLSLLPMNLLPDSGLTDPGLALKGPLAQTGRSQDTGPASVPSGLCLGKARVPESQHLVLPLPRWCPFSAGTGGPASCIWGHPQPLNRATAGKASLLCKPGLQTQGGGLLAGCVRFRGPGAEDNPRAPGPPPTFSNLLCPSSPWSLCPGPLKAHPTSPAALQGAGEPQGPPLWTPGHTPTLRRQRPPDGLAGERT